MEFLISGTHIDPIYLVSVGFVVGILGGFFGVGGSFIAGPALFAAGVPMNFVVGTDLAHIVGKSIVAARKHRALGNVDTKLGMIMVVGTIAGVETGAQVIQELKRRANVDLVVGVTFVIILLSISIFMAWESWKTLQLLRRKRASRRPTATTKDQSAFAFVAKVVHRIELPPFVSLPASIAENARRLRGFRNRHRNPTRNPFDRGSVSLRTVPALRCGLWVQPVPLCPAALQ